MMLSALLLVSCNSDTSKVKDTIEVDTDETDTDTDTEDRTDEENQRG